jgi:hypothetical protein
MSCAAPSIAPLRRRIPGKASTIATSTAISWTANHVSR